jgi:hypothetical protein
MDKGIGFSRTITLNWLDATASLRVQNMDPICIRQHLGDTISDIVTGKDAQRKTIDVLSAIWVKTEKTAPKIHQKALVLFPTLSSSNERLWLHYGMTLICYPFFRNCVAAIGQISRTEKIITRKQIKDRIAGEYGHLGGLDRSVERILASLTNWGALSNTEQKQNYRIVFHEFIASEDLQRWLLTCALHAHPAEAIPFDDLIHLPEIYPFRFTLGIESLQRDTRFEIQRQGGSLVMVRLKID